MSFHPSLPKTDMVKVPRFLLKRYTDALYYAG
jgi:acyl-coenzyme A synthetase/AMP-(fatty) acid ligase